ncbi:hypothetical protein SISNIDRAFT_547180 [Sistotremastrum niveocremeum HHB9708]|uniref:REJ domain-containing protein n=1 Tax=Sistotremastrum niveocremeum HHB9708 TaxID=1314777 RepID=A0A164YQ25_9AGAM|nr:hypothetical protein SISNIDRAFT_547180 [Sistotremastrum niveocremeum HHB9708]
MQEPETSRLDSLAHDDPLSCSDSPTSDNISDNLYFGLSKPFLNSKRLPTRQGPSNIGALSVEHDGNTLYKHPSRRARALAFHQNIGLRAVPTSTSTSSSSSAISDSTSSTGTGTTSATSSSSSISSSTSQTDSSTSSASSTSSLSSTTTSDAPTTSSSSIMSSSSTTLSTSSTSVASSTSSTDSSSTTSTSSTTTSVSSTSTSTSTTTSSTISSSSSSTSSVSSSTTSSTTSSSLSSVTSSSESSSSLSSTISSSSTVLSSTSSDSLSSTSSAITNSSLTSTRLSTTSTSALSVSSSVGRSSSLPSTNITSISTSSRSLTASPSTTALTDTTSTLSFTTSQVADTSDSQAFSPTSAPETHSSSSRTTSSRHTTTTKAGSLSPGEGDGNQSFSHNRGAIIGVVLASVLSAAFMIVWAFFAFRRRRRKALGLDHTHGPGGASSGRIRQGLPRSVRSLLVEEDDGDHEINSLSGGRAATSENAMSEAHSGSHLMANAAALRRHVSDGGRYLPQTQSMQQSLSAGALQETRSDSGLEDHHHVRRSICERSIMPPSAWLANVDPSELRREREGTSPSPARARSTSPVDQSFPSSHGHSSFEKSSSQEHSGSAERHGLSAGSNQEHGDSNSSSGHQHTSLLGVSESGVSPATKERKRMIRIETPFGRSGRGRRSGTSSSPSLPIIPPPSPVAMSPHSLLPFALPTPIPILQSSSAPSRRSSLPPSPSPVPPLPTRSRLSQNYDQSTEDLDDEYLRHDHRLDPQTIYRLRGGQASSGLQDSMDYSRRLSAPLNVMRNGSYDSRDTSLQQQEDSPALSLPPEKEPDLTEG